MESMQMDIMDSVINALPVFLVGFVVGIIVMAIFNKIRGGAANPATTKDAFDQYKADVAEHFTETGKKFQSMASHYQDLYEHLAVGAHTLLDNETADKMLASPNKQGQNSTAESQSGADKKTSNASTANTDKTRKTDKSGAKPQDRAQTNTKGQANTKDSVSGGSNSGAKSASREGAAANTRSSASTSTNNTDKGSQAKK
jgi:uncharacterized membrane-anchored protein YhcB (DUF1043 family)